MKRASTKGGGRRSVNAKCSIVSGSTTPSGMPKHKRGRRSWRGFRVTVPDDRALVKGGSLHWGRASIHIAREMRMLWRTDRMPDNWAPLSAYWNTGSFRVVI